MKPTCVCDFQVIKPTYISVITGKNLQYVIKLQTYLDLDTHGKITFQDTIITDQINP